MIAVVLLNGVPPCVPRLKELAERYPVYAADGGAAICLQAGIRPVWVAGDLDSMNVESLPESWEIRRYPEQTRTDFQKVMADLPESIQEVIVLGGLGGRVDHQFTNLLLAAGFASDLLLTFEHAAEKLIRITPSCPLNLEISPGETLSLLPLPSAAGVSTTGLRWNLENAEMAVGGQLGQSNETTGPVRIGIQSGCLFAWLNRI